MDLTGLKNWFEDNVTRINTDKQGAYWVLKRDHGKTIFNNTTISEPAESWAMLERYVYDQAQNGARSLEVHFKLAPKDRQGYAYPIVIPYNQQMQQQAANIGGLPSAGYSAGIGDLYERRMEERQQALIEKYENKLEAMQRDFENRRKLEELEDHIMAMREEKKTTVDRIVESLEERPQIADKIIGAIAPAIQGLLGNMVPARAQVSVSGPIGTSQVPAGEADGIEHMEGEDPPPQQQAVDFNAPIQATINLMQAGFPDAPEAVMRLSGAAQLMQQLGYEDPVGVIEDIAKFARDNPAMANSLIAQLKTNQDDPSGN